MRIGLRERCRLARDKNEVGSRWSFIKKEKVLCVGHLSILQGLNRCFCEVRYPGIAVRMSQAQFDVVLRRRGKTTIGRIGCSVGPFSQSV